MLERKGTSANFHLNSIGKQTFWLQQLGNFHISLAYVPSADNRADIHTRQSSNLAATLNQQFFSNLWKIWEPFQWDLMASAATVRSNPQGEQKLLMFLPSILNVHPKYIVFLLSRLLEW